jgi:general secretion pathway protein K
VLEIEEMRGRSEDGIVLIAVLWTLTLLSIIAIALSLETRTSTLIARNIAENAAARAAADAGIQRAILDLETSPGSPIESRKFRTDGSVYAWHFGKTIVHISVQDEVGKVNLNQAPEALFAALFASVGIDSSKAQCLADTIADYRDSDNMPRACGAEEAEYRKAGLGWGPKNAPFQTIEELQQILGMTAQIYRLVAPHLTIYSIGAGINPTIAGERLTGILREAGFKYFVGSQGVAAYLIRAEAKGSNGAMFTREAVTQLLPDGTHPSILSWKQDANN